MKLILLFAMSYIFIANAQKEKEIIEGKRIFKTYWCSHSNCNTFIAEFPSLSEADVAKLDEIFESDILTHLQEGQEFDEILDNLFSVEEIDENHPIVEFIIDQLELDPELFP